MCRGSASGKGPFVCSCRQILRSKSIQTEDKDIQIGGDKFQYQIVLIDMDLHEESKGLQKNVQFGPLDFIRFHWGQVILGILCVNRWQVNITNNHIIRVSSGLNNTIRVTISKYQIYPDKPCGPTLSAVTNKRHGYCRFWPIRIRCRRPGPGKENIWPIGLRFAFENLLGAFRLIPWETLSILGNLSTAEFCPHNIAAWTTLCYSQSVSHTVVIQCPLSQILAKQKTVFFFQQFTQSCFPAVAVYHMLCLPCVAMQFYGWCSRAEDARIVRALHCTTRPPDGALYSTVQCTVWSVE